MSNNNCLSTLGVHSDTKLPVVWMHFIKFADMSPEERAQFEFLGHVLNADRRLHGEIFTNAASIKKVKKSRRTGALVVGSIIGRMRAMGWRAGTTGGEQFWFDFVTNTC